MIQQRWSSSSYDPNNEQIDFGDEEINKRLQKLIPNSEALEKIRAKRQYNTINSLNNTVTLGDYGKSRGGTNSTTVGSSYHFPGKGRSLSLGGTEKRITGLKNSKNTVGVNPVNPMSNTEETDLNEESGPSSIENFLNKHIYRRLNR